MNCPKCGKVLIERNGTKGKFMACPGYPNCKYTAPVDTGALLVAPKTTVSFNDNIWSIASGWAIKMYIAGQLPDVKKTEDLIEEAHKIYLKMVARLAK